MRKIKIFWALPFGGFILGYIGTYFFMHQEATVTPNVIGRSLQESVAILSKQRLGVRLVREQEDASLPEGIILDQIPRADNKIRPNQNVFVTVSKKPCVLQAPDFLSSNIKDIQIKASRGDIDVLYINLFTPHPNNTCFAQYPKSGIQIGRHKMTVYLSKGPFPLFIVPNFKGFLVGQVKDCWRSTDVNLEILHSREVLENHMCEQCHVIDQRPIAGSIISFDQLVQIQLSVSE